MSPIPGGGVSTCFSEHELLLIEDLRGAGLGGETAIREIDEACRRFTGVLEHVSEAITLCPRFDTSETIGGRVRSVESLIENLCESDVATVDFLLPTRAILGQSFLHAKINFFKAILYALNGQDAKALEDRVKSVLGDALYFKLAEEVLTGCVANAVNPTPLKRAAAQLLMPMWEHRQSIPLQDFTKLLVSAWRARSRVQEVFGTLVGFHEVQSLLNAECEPRFLDFFNREWGTVDEKEALREFLFGISYEDLHTLNRYMEVNKVANIGPDDVVRILGRSPYHTPRGGWTPETVYLSYHRRRIRADYRVMTRRPGPLKTAEGYLMEYSLVDADGKTAGGDETV